MDINRALRLRDQSRERYRQIFSSAAHYGWTHGEMLAMRNEVLDLLNKLKAPHWVKAYLEGYWQCLQDHAYRDNLVFGGMVDGVFYSVHRDREDYYEKHGIEPSAYADDGRVKHRGHYWKDSHRGVVPFFEMEGR